jgi:hypothetical protein
MVAMTGLRRSGTTARARLLECHRPAPVRCWPSITP